MSKSVKFAPASAVREFATQNGIPMGERGRPNPVAVEAFNKANKRNGVQYVEKAFRPTETVQTVKVNASGRKTPIRKAIVIADAREAAIKAGVPVGARGRLTHEVKAAYVTGDWAPLLASV